MKMMHTCFNYTGKYCILGSYCCGVVELVNYSFNAVPPASGLGALSITSIHIKPSVRVWYVCVLPLFSGTTEPIRTWGRAGIPGKAGYSLYVVLPTHKYSFITKIVVKNTAVSYFE